MKRRLSIISALLIAGTLLAQPHTPLWLRSNSISPDGSKIAFTYQGDIFTVNVTGGNAKQITSHRAHDTNPLWTADSKEIVFASDRDNSLDIYIVSAEGGKPKQLTTHNGKETPLLVTKDGKIIFKAFLRSDVNFSGMHGNGELYIIDKTGGRPQMFCALPISNLTISPNGKILYEDWKGYEDPFRKHHTSSVTRDIWLYEPSESKKTETVYGHKTINGEGQFTQLSTFKGENRNPVFASDGKTYYYLSEESGSFNIYKASIEDKGLKEQITKFTEHPVRYLSIADNGTIAFSYHGELYTIKEGESPKKIEITLVKDVREKDSQLRKFSSSASDLAISPNEKELAFINRGDVYVTAIDLKTTQRITDTPEQERGIAFSKDGRSLYYAAERNGHWGIYECSLNKKSDKYFSFSHDREEKLITNPGETCFQPAVSPDGKYLSFLRDRTELVIKNIKTGKEKSLLKGINYSYTDGDQSYEWSPDSQYIICNYQIYGGWNNEDVALIDIDSGEITNLTESGYTDSRFKWALSGKAMTWKSDKAGYRSHGSWGAEGDVYAMFFDAEAYRLFKQDETDEKIEKLLNEDSNKSKKKDEKKDSTEAEKVEKLTLDLKNRHDRIVKLTKFSGRIGDYYLTPDGKKLYYVVRLESSADLCVADIKKGSIKVLQKGLMGTFYPNKDGKTIYMIGTGGISKIETSSDKRTVLSFKGEYEYKPEAERTYIYDHIWKQTAEKFYDPNMHGINWTKYGEEYKKFLPYIDNNHDFAELLSELLGELNASHTGARYRVRPKITFGNLGIILDHSYEGDGLKIAEVLNGGALNIYVPDVKNGDVVTAINGKEIKAGEDWYPLLLGKAGERVLVSIKLDGKKAKDFYVIPGYTDHTLLYKRWVKAKEDYVEKLSKGKVGYVHVAGMNSESFREVYSKLLGKYRSAEAVIVDTRHNGGGWLHDDLATLLSGKAYMKFQPRGQYISTEPFSKWNKPSCVLIGEDNYSDASGFPYVYKALGIGKLIGAPVPGTMTAVWWESQVDPTLVFGIPQVGSWGIAEQRYLENLQVEPDILVYNDPASALNGEDKQLERAVKEMLKEIKTK